MDYLRTTKPRVVSLFILAAWTGYAMAGGPLTADLVILTLGLAGCVAGAAALNSYLERDRDRAMPRTRNRPLPAGRIASGPVGRMGLALLLGGAALLTAVGWPSAAAALTGGAYYVIVYTLVLKPRFAHSAVVGGVAGLFPPLVGWLAGAGAASGPAASPLLLVYLLAVVFLWSPPHFWALTLVRADEYRSVGVPVPPNSAGGEITRMQMLSFSASLFLLSLLPVAAGVLGTRYLLAAAPAGMVFLAVVAATTLRPRPSLDQVVFRLSGPYLGVLFLAMAVDSRWPGYLAAAPLNGAWA